MPPLSERIELKSKNATDYTDYTDSISLTDDALELERPGAEIEGQRRPQSHGGQAMQGLRVVFCNERGYGFWPPSYQTGSLST